MKLSLILCASSLALAALAMSADGASAHEKLKWVVSGHVVQCANGVGKCWVVSGHWVQADATAPNHEGQCLENGQWMPCPNKQFQSTTVNTSRSNIKNNLETHEACPNGEAPPCPVRQQGDARVNSELEQATSDETATPQGMQTKPRYKLHLVKHPKGAKTIYHY